MSRERLALMLFRDWNRSDFDDLAWLLSILADRMNEALV